MRTALMLILTTATLCAGCGVAICDHDDEPSESCEIQAVLSNVGSCFRPADCCDQTEPDLVAICDDAYPDHVIPVACADGDFPPGLDCHVVMGLGMPCVWGDSAILCCMPSE